MPFSLTWGDRGTYTKFVGKLSIDEVQQANEEHYAGPNFKHINYQIFDFTEADCSGITLEDTKFPAALDTAANLSKPIFKAAMIVVDDYAKTLCESYIKHAQRYNSNWEMAVFNSYNKAIAWCEENLVTT